MQPAIKLVTREDKLPQYTLAAAITTGVSTLIGLGSYHALGLSGLIPAILLGFASGLSMIEKGVRRHREVQRQRMQLRELARLLADGIEAEPGRLSIETRYTGEATPRCYTEARVFRPTGNPRIISLEELEEWRPRYTLIASGDVGVLEAEAYRVRLAPATAYVTVLHENVSVRTARSRLNVRRGSDYAEVVVDAEGPLLSIVASHVGSISYARLEFEVNAPLPLRVKLADVKGRAVRITLPFAPYARHILLLSNDATPADIAVELGEKMLIYGAGIEARLRLLLRRGLRSIDIDETEVKSSTPS